jgi:sulfonate transport system substrate-binding protein
VRRRQTESDERRIALTKTSRTMRSAWTLPVLLALLWCVPVGAGERMRIAYFPNVTHAAAIVGLEQGFFVTALGPDVAIDAKVFNAGPAEIEALFAGEIDLGYVGPGPAITGFVRSKGRALRVVAGSAMGGASLIVRPDAGIESVKDLSGKKLASPQIGNTQDVALRTFLREAGLKTADRGGTVTVLPVANPDVLTLFAKREIDGAWAPEPWASVLRLQARGKELVDERSLWANGKFPTTVVVVSTRFLADHRNLVSRWLDGQRKAVRWLNEHPSEAQAVVNRAIGRLTTREMPAEVLSESWRRLSFSEELPREAFPKLADDAEALGYLPTSDVSGIFELGLAGSP